MEDEKSGREVLMFGKGNNNYFHMFVSHPFSPLQAMAMVIPHFASRIVSKWWKINLDVIDGSITNLSLIIIALLI